MHDDLLRDIEDLRDKWDEILGSRYYSKQLAALLAKNAEVAPKAEGWLGLWKCIRCDRVFEFCLREHNRGYGVCLDNGKPSQMVPYERRGEKDA